MREHRFAIATAIATFVLLIVGSLVHGTGSSLACPDWPLCYGSFFPKMENGVEFEHTHRLVATGVGIMTVTLTVMLLLQGHREGKRSPFGKLGIAATLLVIFQGILGGITVIYRLPRAISIAHLATSMCFFSLMIVIALRTAPSPPAVPGGLGRTRRWLAAAWGVVLAQMVLGALVRHTASGLACLDVPLCNGSVWPITSPEQVQMIHRFGGVITGTFAVWAALRVRKEAEGSLLMQRLALAPIVLVVIQVALGVTSVLSLLNLVVITTHLAVGALLLGSFVLLWGLCPAPARPEGSRLDRNHTSADAMVAS
jgi:heme A synthase